jgi:DNA-directed RNA polymerase subunit RPC12/RpoP
MGKLQLWVVCKACGREFDTRVRMDRRSFERGTLATNYHLCPHCGQRRTYAKADYVIKESSPSRPVGNPDTPKRGNQAP